MDHAKIMTHAGFWIPLAAFTLSMSPAVAQPWTDQQLESQVQGFLNPEAQPRLGLIANLVKHQRDAGRAIATRIHGDHREYLLKVQLLIDQLSSERWPERERAERSLVEIGARARSLLEERKRSGALLEERIRCERILKRIDERGTEHEEREIQILRGLVEAALYMETSERLRRALLSALEHTDPGVAQMAARALGTHGDGAQVTALAGLINRGPAMRRAAVANLPLIPGDEALAQCRAWLLGDELNLTEKVSLVRALRERAGGAPLLRELATHPDRPLAAAAEIDLGSTRNQPIPVSLVLEDGREAQESLIGLRGDRLIVSAPIKGLEEVQIPMGECRAIKFRPADETPQQSGCRLFTKQGSLLRGELRRLKGQVIEIDSPVFGRVTIPRSEVQGLALDPALDRLIGASEQVDRVRLRSRALVDGTCLEITDDEVTVDTGGEELRIPLQDVAGVMFKRPRQAPSDSNLYSRFDLVQGDKIVGHLAGISARGVGIVTPTLGDAVISFKDLARIELDVPGGALWGFTLIADYSDNRLVEVDESGREVFVMEGVFGAWDVECLDSGNLLVTEFSVSRVQEKTRSGETVWSYEDLRNPYDADRLANGNTLIADTFRGRVIEVNPRGELVWQYSDGIRPFDADRLANGNTLIADVLKDRAIEVSPAGEIVWEKTNLPSVQDADRLPNGNTLLTLLTLNRVIEIDRGNKEVFRISGLNAPTDADRLPNGHTLVAENNMVREFDRDGTVVWQKPMTWSVEVNRY